MSLSEIGSVLLGVQLRLPSHRNYKTRINNEVLILYSLFSLVDQRFWLPLINIDWTGKGETALPFLFTTLLSLLRCSIFNEEKVPEWNITFLKACPDKGISHQYISCQIWQI